MNIFVSNDNGHVFTFSKDKEVEGFTLIGEKEGGWVNSLPIDVLEIMATFNPAIVMYETVMIKRRAYAGEETDPESEAYEMDREMEDMKSRPQQVIGYTFTIV